MPATKRGAQSKCNLWVIKWNDNQIISTFGVLMPKGYNDNQIISLSITATMSSLRF